ncbi:hypothetical protein [Caldovatus aquaticus]|uniref:Uncharacterized protein n=1 Tax=Caldovatus aquaticus TaxID=2865671 RepID=A0ABS7EY54_9PROT|nr:hypothetical protein [Caldovatus aquaticus]MBW8268287.1 hypothetical protein [Caldovatus aquaticus]
MAQADALRLCSDALVLIGESPIETFEGASAAQVVANARYQPIADLLLASHPWRFNRRIETLARLADPPAEASGYSAAYALPTDCLRIVAPFVDGTVAPGWEPAETAIWLDAEASQTVALEYHARVDELRWTPAFRQAVVYRLAAEFAVPIRDDPKLQGAMLQLAARELAIARHQNASERPARRIPLGRFEALRRR